MSKKIAGCWCAGGAAEPCACDARVAPRSLSKTLERFYEKCAAFNLRYCPYWRSTGSRNNLEKTFKEFVLLVCFFFTNFVVFVTLTARLSKHIGCAILDSAYWIQRSISNSKSNARCDIILDY